MAIVSEEKAVNDYQKDKGIGNEKDIVIWETAVSLKLFCEVVVGIGNIDRVHEIVTDETATDNKVSVIES